MTDVEFWAQRLAEHLNTVALHTAQAVEHAAAERPWDTVRDTHAALSAATLASETARQWRRALTGAPL